MTYTSSRTLTDVDVVDTRASSPSSNPGLSTLCDEKPIQQLRFMNALASFYSATTTTSLPRRKAFRKKLANDADSESTLAPTLASAPAKTSTNRHLFHFDVLSIWSIFARQLRRNAADCTSSETPACGPAIATPSSPSMAFVIQPPSVIASTVVSLLTNVDNLVRCSKSCSLLPNPPRYRGIPVYQSPTHTTAARACTPAPSSPMDTSTILTAPPVISPDTLEDLTGHGYPEITTPLLTDGCSLAPCESRPRSFVGSGRALPVALAVLTDVELDLEFARWRQQIALGN